MSVANPVGQLSYNGYTFDGATHITVKSDKVRDEAGRIVVYVRHTITVDAIIQVDGGTDARLVAIRTQLERDGGSLVFKDKGFGPIIINAGGARDVKWGPKTQVLSWKPVGSANACEIRWSVTTCVSPCLAEGVQNSTGIMALNYSPSFSVSPRGGVTRTITGYIEIAMTYGGGPGGRAVPDTADSYRHAFAPPVPLGHKRTQSWSVTADKTRVNFTITDTKVSSPNAYPPGIINITANHGVKWSMQAMAYYDHTLTVSMERLPDVTGSYTWSVLAAMLGQLTKGSRRMMTSLSASENLYGWQVSYTVTWRQWLARTSSGSEEAVKAASLAQLRNFISDTRLFAPISRNWAAWQRDMNTVSGPYGYDGLRDNAADDYVIDMCRRGAVMPNQQQSIQTSQQGASRQPFQNNDPPPEESVILSEVETMVEEVRGAAAIPVVPAVVKKPEGSKASADTGEAIAYIDSPVSFEVQPGDVAKTFEYSPGMRRIELKYRAVRIGSPIAPPVFPDTINGKKVQLIHREHTKKKSESNGTVFHGIEGSIEYYAEGAIADIKPNLTFR